MYKRQIAVLLNYYVTAPTVSPSHFDSHMNNESPKYQTGAGIYTCVYPPKKSSIQLKAMKSHSVCSDRQTANTNSV